MKIVKTILLHVLVFQTICRGLHANEPIHLNQDHHLFVDDRLIDQSQGVEFTLHQLAPQEVVLVTDKPWEGNTCAYYSIFQDGKRYRMYYRGSHWDTEKKAATHEEVVCYAESEDGIHWNKPALGLFEFEGSKDNNIVWNGVGSHNFTPFVDNNPNCPPESRYKALGRGRSLKPGDKKSKHGLFAFQSSDGLQWQLMSQTPVITEGAFDSQNLAFYDPRRGEYVEYHRWFNQGVRDIMLCTSQDFLHWSKPVGLKYEQDYREHLYTNAIGPYFRSPSLYLGFPTRYLPDEGQRVEPILMTSHDGLKFKRWREPVVPEDAPSDRSGNRSNYMARGVLQLPSDDNQLSVYATEAYYTGPDSRLRRFTYRTDGFVSLHAGENKGSVITHDFVFNAEELLVNVKSQANGFIRVGFYEPNQNPISGFGLDDCEPFHGDSIGERIRWKGDPSLKAISGQAVRMIIEIRNADVFSFQLR